MVLFNKFFKLVLKWHRTSLVNKKNDLQKRGQCSIDSTVLNKTIIKVRHFSPKDKSTQPNAEAHNYRLSNSSTVISLRFLTSFGAFGKDDGSPIPSTFMFAA